LRPLMSTPLFAGQDSRPCWTVISSCMDWI
jgi:hypothetical protein